VTEEEQAAAQKALETLRKTEWYVAALVDGRRAESRRGSRGSICDIFKIQFGGYGWMDGSI